MAICQFIIYFSITLGILVGLLYLSALIPKTAFRENMLQSAKYLEKNEDEFYRLIENDRSTEIHNYADAITFNIMYSIDGEGLWEELAMSPFYSDRINAEYPMIQLLVERIGEEKQADTIYDRYWHGMMIVLRPLFCIFNIQEIRILMLFILLALLAILSVQLWRKGLHTLAVALWIAAMLTKYPMIAFCVEYQPVWLIMLLVSLAVLKFYRKEERVAGLCVISGVCCAFFDFLTTETVAIAIPLAIVLCLYNKIHLFDNFRKNILLLFWWCADWVIAYIGTLFVKWGFASVVLGQERFSYALNMMLYRQGATSISADADRVISEAGTTMPFSQQLTGLLVNIRLLLGLSEKVSLEGLLLGILLCVAVIACVIYLFRKKGKECVFPALLFLVGAIPVLRILVLNNHSLEHCFFVYRSLFATIVCVVTGFVSIIDWELVNRLCRRKKKANISEKNKGRKPKWKRKNLKSVQNVW